MIRTRKTVNTFSFLNDFYFKFKANLIMENENRGPYRPFLPLDSSSPLKDDEEVEVAYRENQAAGLIAPR